MDELQNYQNILDEFLQVIQQVLSSGEELPDELLGMVAKEIEWLVSKIETLSTPKAPDLDAAPYPSSNINAFKYDPKTQKLFIKFQDKWPLENGPVYSYENIPPFIYEIFRRGAVAPKTSGSNKWHRWRKGVTPSLGASAYALIRLGGYPYKRLR